MTKTCETCRFWVEEERPELDMDGNAWAVGQCRRFPPDVKGPAFTETGYWCGEWQGEQVEVNEVTGEVNLEASVCEVMGHYYTGSFVCARCGEAK